MKVGVALAGAGGLVGADAPNVNVELVGNDPNVGAADSLAPKVAVETFSPDPKAGVLEPKAGNGATEEEGVCPKGPETEGAPALGCPNEAKGAAGVRVLALVVRLPPKPDTAGAGGFPAVTLPSLLEAYPVSMVLPGESVSYPVILPTFGVVSPLSPALTAPMLLTLLKLKP